MRALLVDLEARTVFLLSPLKGYSHSPDHKSNNKGKTERKQREKVPRRQTHPPLGKKTQTVTSVDVKVQTAFRAGWRQKGHWREESGIEELTSVIAGCMRDKHLMKFEDKTMAKVMLAVVHFLPVYLSVCLSVRLFIYRLVLSVCLSVSLPVHLSSTTV